MMSSPLKKQPEAVADKVLKRVEVSKVRRILFLNMYPDLSFSELLVRQKKKKVKKFKLKENTLFFFVL